jgi:hypothetical protein
VTVKVKARPGGARASEVLRLVVARAGVVVAVATTPVLDGPFEGLVSVDLEPVACGGPDALKALPDGTYAVYALVTEPTTGALGGLSPGEPLVLAGNAREVWCHADESVLGAGDSRVAVTGDVASDPAEVLVDLNVSWSGFAEAQVMDQRVVMVDEATGRIALDTATSGMVRDWILASLVPGDRQHLSLTSRRSSCDGGALPSGTYRVQSVLTIAPTGADTGARLPTNTTAVAQIGRVVVP